jgi:hypothetical protein
LIIKTCRYFLPNTWRWTGRRRTSRVIGPEHFTCRR